MAQSTIQEPGAQTILKPSMAVRLATASALLLILAVSAVLPLNGLNDSLDADEFFMALAARSYAQDGSMRLGPGLNEYKGGRMSISLIALSYNLFGDSEASARLPSKLLTLLTIILVYAAGRVFMSNGAGLWSAAIFAFLPRIIEQSAFCRMYPLARLMVLCAALIAFPLIESFWQSRSWRSLGAWLKRPVTIPALAGCILLFFIAYSEHKISIVAPGGVCAYLLYLIIVRVKEEGLKAALSCPPSLVLFGISAAGIVALALNPGVAGYFISSSQYLADWAAFETHPLTYHWELQSLSPLLYAIFPLGLLLIFAKKIKPAIYFSLIFLVSFFVLTIVFRWKGERFLSPYLPFYAIITGYAAHELARLLAGALSAALPARSKGFIYTLVALAVLGAGIASGHLQSIAKRKSFPHDQRSAYEYVTANKGDGDAVASVFETAAIYYNGSVEYKIQGVTPLLKYLNCGDIFTHADIMKALEKYPRLWLVVENDKLHLQNQSGLTTISPEIRALLKTRTPEYQSGRREVNVYLFDAQKEQRENE